MCLTQEELDYDGKMMAECEKNWEKLNIKHSIYDKNDYVWHQHRNANCTCGYHKVDLEQITPNRFVRKIDNDNWCDRCRVFTDNPEAHDHDKRPLD